MLNSLEYNLSQCVIKMVKFNRLLKRSIILVLVGMFIRFKGSQI